MSLKFATHESDDAILERLQKIKKQTKRKLCQETMALMHRNRIKIKFFQINYVTSKIKRQSKNRLQKNRSF